MDGWMGICNDLESGGSHIGYSQPNSRKLSHLFATQNSICVPLVMGQLCQEECASLFFGLWVSCQVGTTYTKFDDEQKKTTREEPSNIGSGLAPALPAVPNDQP